MHMPSNLKVNKSTDPGVITVSWTEELGLERTSVSSVSRRARRPWMISVFAIVIDAGSDRSTYGGTLELSKQESSASVVRSAAGRCAPSG